MRNPEVLFALLVGLLLQPSAIYAQLKTIPQQLAEQGTDLRSGASVPSGASPDVDVILRDTDVIVRGVVGNPRSYLSDDQLTIFSDYPIAKPVILFDTMIASSSKPGPAQKENSDKQLMPLTGARDFAPAYRGVEATTAVNSIVARRHAVVR